MMKSSRYKMQYQKYMDVNVSVRFYNNEFNETRRLVEECIDSTGSKKYDSLSHFVRCAVIKLIREEKKRGV